MTDDDWTKRLSAWNATWRTIWMRWGPAALTADWMFWGVLHFLAPAKGVQQMPTYFAPFEKEIFAFSGVVEIWLAIAMFTRWRRQALLATCGLLLLFTPAVAHMLVNDAAVDTLPWPNSLGGKRIFLVLHNSLMLLLAYALYDSSRPRAGQGASDSPVGDGGAARATRSLRKDNRATIAIAITMVAANLAGIWGIARAPWYSTTPTLWAIGCLVCGAVIGFLFGVPKTGADKAPADKPATGQARGGYRPNTNIEELSDWLTKMIVGVGLVQLHAIGPWIHRVATDIAAGLLTRDNVRATNMEEAVSFAEAIVVYFSVAGVVQGYLSTRLFLAREFERNELPETLSPTK